MVRLRKLRDDDIEHLKKLHEKYYPQFEFPDFFDRFLAQFAIVDENDELILGGGVRPIAETIIVTDQDKDRVKIGRALVEAQKFSMVAAARFKIDELHAFVDNPQYANHLVRHGFTQRSPAYSIRVF